MSDASATVSLTVAGCTGSPFTLYPSPGSPATLDICADNQFTGTGPSSGYQIGVARTDNADASLHVVFKATHPTYLASEDAFLALPETRLGDSYWVMGYRAAATGDDARWAVVSDDDLVLNYRTCADSSTTTSMADNRVFQQKCALGTAREDGSGYRIWSSDGEKLALISGALCGDVPVGVHTCDTLLEMFPPDSWAGNDYLVTEFAKDSPGGDPGDVFRIMALGSSAAVTVSVVSGGSSSREFSAGYDCPSSSSFTLSSGAFCDLAISGGARVSATNPILIGQFSKGSDETGTGDSSFMLVTPTSHFRCAHRFFSFEGFDFDSGTLDGSYVNIVAPSSALAGLSLDGSSLSSGTTCIGYSKIDYPSPSGYSWTRCRLADPPSGGQEHTLSTGSTPAGVYVYGFRHDGAYSYPAGVGF